MAVEQTQLTFVKDSPVMTMARNLVFQPSQGSPASSLFENDFDGSDPWNSSQQSSRMQGVLGDIILPDVYTLAFNLAGPVQGSVSTSALLKILQISGISHATIEKIMLLVVPPTRNRVTRSEFNVALSLIAFAQSNMDISIENVAAHKNDLPSLSLPNLNAITLHDSSPTDIRRVNRIPSTSIDNSDPWRTSSLNQSHPVAESHRHSLITSPITTNVPETPIQEDDLHHLGAVLGSETISVTLQPEKEGFILKHQVYLVESPSRRTRVARRYSDFWWLMETLHKIYPLRLLPSVPPKRLGGYYLASDESSFLEKRRRGLHRFINAIARHPVIKENVLFEAFLTEQGEFSSWKKSASIDIEEESLKAASYEVESHTSPSLAGVVIIGVPEDFDERIEKTKAKLKPCLDNYRTMAVLVERIARRYEGQATDFLRYSLSINSFCENDRECYRTDCNTCRDIHMGLRSVSTSFQKLSTLLEDQGQSAYDNALESLKRHRDLLVSLRELLHRRDRMNENLESLHNSLLKKIDNNKQKLSAAQAKVDSLGNSLNPTEGEQGATNSTVQQREAAESEVKKLSAQISIDEHDIQKINVRKNYGRKAIWQEINFWHRQQAFVSLLYQDLVRDFAGRTAAQERSWKDLYTSVAEMPI